MSSKRVVVRLRAGSDGDATHIPNQGKLTKADPPTQWLDKLGQEWMKARGEARPGIKYTLESLPAGYTLWQRARPTGPSHIDRYLYGHPSHKPFDSSKKFYTHFEYMMNNAGDTMGCPCAVCIGGSAVPPKGSSSINASSSSAASSRASSPKAPSRPQQISPLFQTSSIPQAPAQPQYKGRPKTIGVGMDMSRVDEEGTPDVYRNLIDKLRRYGTVDEAIKEPMCLDWRSEQQTIPDWTEKIKNDAQWTPRSGEIVLFTRELPAGVQIVFCSSTGSFQLFDERSGDWTGAPRWEAGLVGQTPTEPITTGDITVNVKKEGNVTYHGVRVEPLPCVNDPDKSLSKRHTYVPLCQVRPFVLWKQLLSAIPSNTWHPTITSALTVTSNLSLIGRHRFWGVWPDAQIYCHGIFLGHELLAVGDTVRLLPRTSVGQSTCTDVMVIKSIRLKWSNLDRASKNDWDDGEPYNSVVWIHGSAYTSDSSRVNKEWLSAENTQPPRAADDYVTMWYPLHPSSKELRVPYSRIMGRLFEKDAMALWLSNGAEDASILDAGREAVMEARKYSRENDQRILDGGAEWYWGDDRSQALDLQTINGLDVAKHDQKRDPREWRKKVKILEDMENGKPVPTSNEALPAGVKNLQAFMAPDLDTTRSTHLSRKTNSEMNSSTTGSTSGERSVTGNKRNRTFDMSDDENEPEDEREILQHTKIVDDRSGAERKKSRVMIVID